MQPSHLTNHPEGGRFQEVFRSNSLIAARTGAVRTALTHIYFSLNKGEASRFHKVSSDEVWNLYQGDGIRLYSWDVADDDIKCITLSASTHTFCHVIPAGTWQAAEPLSATVLVGCSVAPGFEFDDFELIDPNSECARKLISIDASLRRFIA